MTEITNIHYLTETKKGTLKPEFEIGKKTSLSFLLLKGAAKSKSLTTFTFGHIANIDLDQDVKPGDEGRDFRGPKGR